MKRSIMSFIFVAGLAACAGQTTSLNSVARATAGLTDAVASSRNDEDNLTEAFATFRKTQVRSAAYDIRLDLQKGASTFTGTTTLHLELARLDQPLSIDLLSQKITRVEVNGNELTGYPSRKGSFDVPVDRLAEKMDVTVVYTAEFSNGHIGLFHFVDPADKAEYIYSQLEPYGAHQVFACLDQPNIKATYNLTVRGPKSWKFMANTPETSVAAQTRPAPTTQPSTRPAATQEALAFHAFATTPLLSTYLVFIGAGDYQQWKGQADTVPLSIYARKSMAGYIDAAGVFDITRRGLKFYNAFFGMPFPFPKYDQIFAPDLTSGAMENPGAVTINESALFKGPVTQEMINWRSGTILHEMAHMWFGDLVTMNWWNDLWLNESFASYMAALVQTREFKMADAWFDFFSEKTWGYWQDSLVTTHAVETPVEDVVNGMANFDGITYAKGGAALKQLHFLVGDEAFTSGVRDYFKKYAWRNTVRANFTDAIASAAKTNLDSWSKTWLQTAGLNLVTTDWTCDGATLKSFRVLQSPSISQIFAPHRTLIGFYHRDGTGKLTLTQTIPVDFSKSSTEVKEAVSKPCPDFVFPNQDDQDYALYALDPVSTKMAMNHLSDLPDALTRSMVWDMLYQMVRSQKLSAQDYLQTVINQTPAETDARVISLLWGNRSNARSVRTDYLTVDQRKELASDLETMLWKQVLAATPKSSTQLVFFEASVRFSQTPLAHQRLRDLLAGREKVEGLKIDQNLRWLIIRCLAWLKDSDSETFIKKELIADPSKEGVESAYGARVAFADPATAQNYWNEFWTKGAEMPRGLLDWGVANFHNRDNPERMRSYREPFFTEVARRNWATDYNLIEPLFKSLFPFDCSADLLAMSQTKLKELGPQASPLLKRAWAEVNDELARCVRVRAYSHKP